MGEQFVMGTQQQASTADTVDQEAETVDSTCEAGTVPLGADTKPTLHLLTLLYPRDTPKKLSDKFPRGRITKQAGQRVLMGRSKELDVLLNEEHMPRIFVELWCENQQMEGAAAEGATQGGGPKWFVKNKNTKKPVRIGINGARSSFKLKGEEQKLIEEGCEVKLEGLTLIVKLHDGDISTGDFEVEFRPMPIETNWQQSFSSSSGSGNSDLSVGSAAELAQRQQNGGGSFSRNQCGCGGGAGGPESRTSSQAYFGTPQPSSSTSNMSVQQLTQLVANLPVSGAHGGPSVLSSAQSNASTPCVSCPQCGQNSQGPVQVIVVSVPYAGNGSTGSHAMPAAAQRPQTADFPVVTPQAGTHYFPPQLTTNPATGLRHPHSSPHPNQSSHQWGIPMAGQSVQGAFTSPAPPVARGGGGGGATAFAELGQMPTYSSYQGSQNSVLQSPHPGSNVQQSQQCATNQNQTPSFVRPNTPDRLCGPFSMPQQGTQMPVNQVYFQSQQEYEQFLAYQQYQQQQQQTPAQQLHFHSQLEYEQFRAQQQQHQQLGTVATQPESAQHGQQPQSQVQSQVSAAQPVIVTNRTAYTVTEPEGNSVLPTAPPARFTTPVQVASLGHVQFTSETPTNSVLESWGLNSGLSSSVAAVASRDGSATAGHSRHFPAQNGEQSSVGSRSEAVSAVHAVGAGSSQAQLQQRSTAAGVAPNSAAVPHWPDLGSGQLPAALPAVHVPAVASSTLTTPSSNGNFVNLRAHDAIGPTPPPSSDFSTLSSYNLFDVQAWGARGHRGQGSGREPEEDDERGPTEHDDNV